MRVAKLAFRIENLLTIKPVTEDLHLNNFNTFLNEQ